MNILPHLHYNCILLSFIILLSTLVLGGCQDTKSTSTDISKPVVTIGPYALYSEDIPNINSLQYDTDIDSATFRRSFITEWTKEKAFELDAVTHLKNRSELDKLVDAYRSSLLTHLYEEQLISEHIDSMISPEELNQYYQENKSQYVLSSTIMRIHFIQVDGSLKQINQLEDLWKRADDTSALDSLIALSNEIAETFILNDSVWYRKEDLQAIIPRELINSPHANKDGYDHMLKQDTSNYYLRIIQQIPDTEIAPLSFIQRQARKVILHKRRQKYIEEMRNNSYLQAVKSGRVKLFETVD